VIGFPLLADPSSPHLPLALIGSPPTILGHAFTVAGLAMGADGFHHGVRADR